VFKKNELNFINSTELYTEGKQFGVLNIYNNYSLKRLHSGDVLAVNCLDFTFVRDGLGYEVVTDFGSDWLGYEIVTGLGMR